MQYFEADPKARTEKRNEQSSGATVRADCSPVSDTGQRPREEQKSKVRIRNAFPK